MHSSVVVLLPPNALPPFTVARLRTQVEAALAPHSYEQHPDVPEDDDVPDGGKWDYWTFGDALAWIPLIRLVSPFFAGEPDPPYICQARYVAPERAPATAVALPDGTWQDDGWTLGPGDPSWPARYAALLRSYPDHWAVLVDCHS